MQILPLVLLDFLQTDAQLIGIGQAQQFDLILMVFAIL